MVTFKTTRQIQRSILIILSVLSTTSLYAQKIELNRAIKHFESRNVALAEKEIEQAISIPFSSKKDLSKAMYYYFLIKTDLYCTEDAIEDNIERLPKIVDAFNTCMKNDTEEKYSPLLKPKVDKLEDLVLNSAQIHYETRNFLKYFYTMDHHTLLLEMRGESGGSDYDKLAQEAGKLGYGPLRIKYLRKMIKANYRKRYAYEALMANLHALKKYEQVENLLAQAKRDFPETTAFANIESLITETNGDH